MKASELINKLQALITKHGDLELFHLYSQNGCNDSDDWFAIYDDEPEKQTVYLIKDCEYKSVSVKYHDFYGDKSCSREMIFI